MELERKGTNPPAPRVVGGRGPFLFPLWNAAAALLFFPPPRPPPLLEGEEAETKIR